MSQRTSSSKVGVFVDVVNLYRNGGQRMRYDVLREFACRDGAEPVRLNAYVSFDPERAANDSDYERKARGFHSALRDLGYKVNVSTMRWTREEGGGKISSTSSDLALAVDMLLQSENLDRVLIASGNGDYARAVRALQDRGARVEVVGVDQVSETLRHEADLFVPAYLIPELIPIASERQEAWGEVGSRVRGWCYWHHREEMYGFMRFLREVAPGLWLSDTRHPGSPYGSAFFHDSNLPYEVVSEDLPNRDILFEFRLVNAEKNDGFQCMDIQLATEF